MVGINTFFQHASRNPLIRREEAMAKVGDLHVCPHCSSLTLTDTRRNDPVRKYKTCPSCGWHGPPTKTLRQLIKEDGIVKGGQLHLR